MSPDAGRYPNSSESLVSQAGPAGDYVPQTREELVADRLRRAILVGHFLPGEKLDQGLIAQQMGVSIIPVREAIRTLTAEDLVSLVPHKGAFVTERTPEELEELHFILGILEGAAFSAAIDHIANDQIETLARILQEAESSSDFEYILGLNQDFHRTIYTACRRPQLAQMIQRIHNKLAAYYRLYLDAGYKSEAWAEHRKMYEACLRHDGAGASEAAQRHSQHVCNKVLSVLQHTGAKTRVKDGIKHDEK